MSVTSKSRLVRKLLSSKEYRDAYVEERIKTGIPFQLRAMRAVRNWSQATLGKMAGMRQNAISRIEDEEYGSLSINTLIRLASAFDTGLIVKFVPFSRLVREYEDVSPARLESRSITSKQEVADLSKWTKEERVDAALSKASTTAHSVFIVYAGGSQPTLFGNPEKAPLSLVADSTPATDFSPADKTATPIDEIKKESVAYARIGR